MARYEHHSTLLQHLGRGKRNLCSRDNIFACLSALVKVGTTFRTRLFFLSLKVPASPIGEMSVD